MMELKHSILVVDDDIDWKEILFGILEDWGYLVMYAANVEEAKKLLNQHKFSLITIDLEFKERRVIFEKGPNLLAYIQHNFSHIPCIVISGSDRSIGDSTDLVLKFHHIVRKYLTKDDKKLPDKLIKEVEKAIAESTKSFSPLSAETEEFQSEDQQSYLRKLLQQRNKNLQTLEMQKAQYGSLEVPLRVLNAIEEEQLEIERLTHKLAELQKPTEM